jgi:hypothetical protein
LRRKERAQEAVLAPNGADRDTGIGTALAFGEYDLHLSPEGLVQAGWYQAVRLHERVGLCRAERQVTPGSLVSVA